MVNDAIHVELVAGALEQQPAGGVTQNIKVAVVHGAQNPLGLLIFAKGEARMDGADRVIEFAQQLVRIIERAIGQNIDFGGFQDTEAVQVFIQRSMKRICCRRSSTDTPPAIFKLWE